MTADQIAEHRRLFADQLEQLDDLERQKPQLAPKVREMRRQIAQNLRALDAEQQWQAQQIPPAPVSAPVPVNAPAFVSGAAQITQPAPPTAPPPAVPAPFRPTPADFPTAPNASAVPRGGPGTIAYADGVKNLTSAEAVRTGEYAKHRDQLLAEVGYKPSNAHAHSGRALYAMADQRQQDRPVATHPLLQGHRGTMPPDGSAPLLEAKLKEIRARRRG